MIEVLCHKCKKQFDFNEKLSGNSLSQALSDTDEYTCYSCALRSLTGGRAPEEGDFNSARLISGEISEKELKWLREDLRAVELGCSIREDDDTDSEETDYLEYYESCSVCGATNGCPACDERDSDFDEEE